MEDFSGLNYRSYWSTTDIRPEEFLIPTANSVEWKRKRPYIFSVTVRHCQTWEDEFYDNLLQGDSVKSWGHPKDTRILEESDWLVFDE